MEYIDHDALLEKEPTKKREDLTPEYVLLPDSNQEVEAFSMADAATYLGLERVSFTQMLNRLKKQGKPVPVYQKSYGGISRYVLKRDLDELRRVKQVE